MYYKLIILCFLPVALYGCAKNNQSGAAQSGPCRTIKQQMVRTYPSQIQRPTAINNARLLRDYEYYNCDQ